MELHGKSVFGGIAMGRLSVYQTDNAVKNKDTIKQRKAFEDAKEEAKDSLKLFL